MTQTENEERPVQVQTLVTGPTKAPERAIQNDTASNDGQDGWTIVKRR